MKHYSCEKKKKGHEKKAIVKWRKDNLELGVST